MWETYKKEELETKLNTNFLKGLKFEEAKKRQMKYGKNELENKKKVNIQISIHSLAN